MEARKYIEKTDNILRTFTIESADNFIELYQYCNDRKFRQRMLQDILQQIINILIKIDVNNPHDKSIWELYHLSGNKDMLLRLLMRNDVLTLSQTRKLFNNNDLLKIPKLGKSRLAKISSLLEENNI